MTMFSGALHILHQYKSNFAYLLSFKNLVIEFLNVKMFKFEAYCLVPWCNGEMVQIIHISSHGEIVPR